eukprot:TRINITY_DN4367_c1_g2_i3.p2 TRINITY_DN4367_c1_g2~~TRINITY_DN4367_c1_g2_i3.p2  ORF type:complete len:218 (-),score=6.38 TRINITY_DN4367_c1_g2_i3:178-831(-)
MQQQTNKLYYQYNMQYNNNNNNVVNKQVCTYCACVVVSVVIVDGRKHNQTNEQWPDFGCEGIKVQRAHQPTSQCQGKKMLFCKCSHLRAPRRLNEHVLHLRARGGPQTSGRLNVKLRQGFPIQNMQTNQVFFIFQQYLSTCLVNLLVSYILNLLAFLFLFQNLVWFFLFVFSCIVSCLCKQLCFVNNERYDIIEQELILLTNASKILQQKWLKINLG